MKIIPVILCGGYGKRLWPLSRKQHPKQILNIEGEHSMLQATIMRLKGLKNITDPMIVTNKEHRFLVAEQIQNLCIHNSTILLEPVSKNTAPAIAASALKAMKDNDNEPVLLLVLPADHIIKDVKEFHRAVNEAAKEASEKKLVTFGIVPTKPNTGYGYIKVFQKNLEDASLKVDKFIEKPNYETAKKFIEKGNYLWNSGMFMFQADIIIEELSLYAKEVVIKVKKAVESSTESHDFVSLHSSSFEASPNISIDYALMEKTKELVVIPLDAGWSDVGSWSSLYELNKKDHNLNVVRGDVLMEETTNCYINADNHLVATLGVNNLIIVDTPDATLVASQDKAQFIHLIVEQLKQLNRDEENYHRKVYRPWGWYDSIESGEGFQVKVISVNPGSILSLQRHKHRAEHWIVVKGEGRVTRGEDNFVLTKNQSTYIEKETMHRLENIGKEPLEIIEVQIGNYLGEDDIERFDDLYGRIPE